MKELDYEELKQNPEKLSDLFQGEDKEELLEEIISNENFINNNEMKLKIYKIAIKTSNRRIEQLEDEIDEAKIESVIDEKRIEELEKILEKEEEWRNKNKIQKDSLINEIAQIKQKIQNEADNQSKTNDEEENELNIYDEKGFNKKGYDAEGYDKNGFNEKGIHRKTRTEYAPDGFNKQGYDRDWYDRCGYNIMGYDRDGYDSKGYNVYGYTRNGLDENGNYNPIFDFTKSKKDRMKEETDSKKTIINNQIEEKTENSREKKEATVRNLQQICKQYGQELRKAEKEFAEKYGLNK